MDIYFIMSMGFLLVFGLWLIHGVEKREREKREKYRKQLEEQERLILNPKEDKKRDQDERK